MSDCCGQEAGLEMLRQRQTGTLKTVFAINAVTFFVVVGAGIHAGSSALLSDGLDDLGDALTYGMSLYAVRLGMRMKARVAFFKGALILLAALAVIAQIGYRFMHPAVPVFELMGVFSLFALVTNGACFALLWRHRSEDINMSSVWECSRNDVLSNLSVFVAAGGVWATGSAWPDLLVASILVLIFLRSATRVLSGARLEMQRAG